MEYAETRCYRAVQRITQPEFKFQSINFRVTFRCYYQIRATSPTVAKLFRILCKINVQTLRAKKRKPYTFINMSFEARPTDQRTLKVKYLMFICISHSLPTKSDLFLEKQPIKSRAILTDRPRDGPKYISN